MVLPSGDLNPEVVVVPPSGPSVCHSVPPGCRMQDLWALPSPLVSAHRSMNVPDRLALVSHAHT